MKIRKDERQQLVRQVQEHFRTDLDLEIGELRAGLLLDFFEHLIGPAVYNEAVDDARAIVAARADTIQEELLGLARRTSTRESGARKDAPAPE